MIVMFYEDEFWVWILPSKEREEMPEWRENGGKWLVYDKKENLEKLAKKIEAYVESGEIEAAKYWRWDTSALCVYSLDRDRDKTKKILQDIGAKITAWEYDYARRKNFYRLDFIISHFHKLWILIKTFGILGTLRFLFGVYV